MNLTEAERARAMIESLLSRGTVVAAESTDHDWKKILGRIAIIAFGYGVFFALKRRFCPAQRTVRVYARLRNTSPEANEVCPICLDTPKFGVRPGCGHRLCARCLVLYYESQLKKRSNGRPGPPPCPLCRMPLVSVSFTYDQINLPPPDGTDCAVDSATAGWLQEYNARGGLLTDTSVPGFLLGNATVLMKLLLASITVGVIARTQVLTTIDIVAYSSILVTALGLILLVCLWYKCQEEELEDDY